MTITLSILYYLYLLAVAVFVLYSLFNIYHLLRFGFLTSVNVLVIVAYVGVAAILLFFSFNLLAAVDWSLPLMEFSGLSS